MAKDTGELVVAPNGTIYVAPLGTAIPASADEAFAAGWVDLGYASEDGVTVTDGKDIEEIRVWQLLYPARRVITGRTFTIAFSLAQWNEDTVPLAFGGGTVTTDAGPPVTYTYEPPEPEAIDERMIAVEWVDGTRVMRMIARRAMVTENVETQLVANAPALLPITMGVLGEAGVKPFVFQTTDAQFGAAA